MSVSELNKKKVQGGEGVELKMQASPTSYYLLTPKMNYWNGRRKILANAGEAGPRNCAAASLPNSSTTSPSFSLSLLLPVHFFLSLRNLEENLESRIQEAVNIKRFFLTFSLFFPPTFFPLILNLSSDGVLYFYPFASVFAALFICIIALDGN